MGEFRSVSFYYSLLNILFFTLIPLSSFAELAIGRPSSDKDFGDVDIYYSHTSSNPSALPQKNLGNDIFYQVFVDRFSNGNQKNDCLHEGRFCSPDRSKWYHFWGGDLRGIINHLDYLKGLGITKLWLSPIFENQMLTVTRERYGRLAEITAYHGYWIRDWFRLSPDLTDQGSLDFNIVNELVDKSAPELGIILDTVTNHTSPTNPTAWSLDYANGIEPLPMRNGVPRSHAGVLFKNGTYVTSYSEDVYRSEHESGYEAFFHHFPPITDWNDPFQLENYTLDSLADLSQDNPVNRDYLDEAHAFWLKKFPKIAGYRMDTIKHVPLWYWKEFASKLYGAFPQTMIVGEHFGAGPYDSSSFPFYQETPMSLFDFNFRSSIESIFLRGWSFQELTKYWEQDPRLINAREMVTFLDNHDLPRLRGLGMKPEAMRQATTLLFVSRGVPCLFYGLEQDLYTPNDLGDPYNRPMMSSFNTSAPFYQLIQKLAGLRKKNPALRYGVTHIVHLTDNIIGFERIFEHHKIFVALSKNPRQGSDSFPMINLTMPNQQYRDVITGETYTVSQGRINLSLKNGDIVLLSTD